MTSMGIGDVDNTHKISETYTVYMTAFQPAEVLVETICRYITWLPLYMLDQNMLDYLVVGASRDMIPYTSVPL